MSKSALGPLAAIAVGYSETSIRTLKIAIAKIPIFFMFSFSFPFFVYGRVDGRRKQPELALKNIRQLFHHNTANLSAFIFYGTMLHGKNSDIAHRYQHMEFKKPFRNSLNPIHEMLGKKTLCWSALNFLFCKQDSFHKFLNATKK